MNEDSTDDNDIDEDSNDDQGNDGAEVEVHHSSGHLDLSGRRAAALLKVKELRAEHGQNKSVERRQKVCENIQKAVNNKLKAFNNAADKHLQRLDGVFTKLKDYQSTNNVAAENYDALVATATEKQTSATQAVQTLKDFGAVLDCSSDDPAASLQAVKTAAADARGALKDYRKSLKDIVVALAQAKGDDTTNSDDNGGEE
jgi:hypothetical protein